MKVKVSRECFIALIPEVEIWHINFSWELRIGWLLWCIEIKLLRLE